MPWAYTIMIRLLSSDANATTRHTRTSVHTHIHTHSHAYVQKYDTLVRTRSPAHRAASEDPAATAAKFAAKKASQREGSP